MNIGFVVAFVALAFVGGCGVGYATHAKDTEGEKIDKSKFNRGGLEKVAKYQYMNNAVQGNNFNSDNHFDWH